MKNQYGLGILTLLFSVVFISCGTDTKNIRSHNVRSNDDVIVIVDGSSKINDDKETPIVVPPKEYKWSDNIKLTIVPEHRTDISSIPRISTTDVYNDIYKYAQYSALVYSFDPITNITDTVYLMQYLDGVKDTEEKFIYYKQGKGSVTKEPSLATKDIQSYIPDIIKDQISVYEACVTEQPESPILENIFSKWNIEMTRSLASFEMFMADISRVDETNELDAAVELFILSSAATVAVHKKDLAYSDFTQFKATYAMMLDKFRELIMQAFKTTLVDYPSKVSPMLQDFLNTSVNEDVLSGLKTIYGDKWFDQNITTLLD